MFMALGFHIHHNRHGQGAFGWSWLCHGLVGGLGCAPSEEEGALDGFGKEISNHAKSLVDEGYN